MYCFRFCFKKNRKSWRFKGIFMYVHTIYIHSIPEDIIDICRPDKSCLCMYLQRRFKQQWLHFLANMCKGGTVEKFLDFSGQIQWVLEWLEGFRSKSSNSGLQSVANLIFPQGSEETQNYSLQISQIKYFHGFPKKVENIACVCVKILQIKEFPIHLYIIGVSFTTDLFFVLFFPILFCICHYYVYNIVSYIIDKLR